MNGIRVNGHRIVETELHPDDEVAIADILFTFRRDDAPRRPARANPGVLPIELAPAADDVSSVIPLPLPDEDEPLAYEPPAKPGHRSDIRLKDDSHSDHAPVHV
jgi:hypothetical protein